MSEIRIPLTLIGISLPIYAGFGFFVAGPAGAAVTVLLLLLQALMTTFLGVGACFITAAVFSTDFGTLKSACVKLAAVALFPSAAGLLASLVSPIIGVLLAVVLFFALLKSLFDLEMFELIVFVVVLLGVSSVAEQAVGWILSSVS
jgi:hypothetical protein